MEKVLADYAAFIRRTAHQLAVRAHTDHRGIGELIAAGEAALSKRRLRPRRHCAATGVAIRRAMLHRMRELNGGADGR